MRDEEALLRYSLASNKNLETVGFEDEADWLQLRTKGIGGSDVGAIMGLNKYASPLKIYKAKVMGIQNDVSDKPAVKKGKTMEPIIREQFFKPMLEEKGFTVLPLNHMLINKNYPWLRANLDGIIIPLDETKRVHTNCMVAEIKYVTSFAEDAWFGDEYNGVPASYYAQVQEYMLVTETKSAILGALFESTWEMHYFQINANPTFQQQLLNMSKTFFEYNMALQIPPKFDAELDKEDILQKIVEPVETTVETQEMTDLGMQYKELNSKIKELEGQKKLVVTEITNRYLQGERSNSPAVKIKLTATTKTALDKERLEKEHPEIVKEYQKTTEYTTTYIR